MDISSAVKPLLSQTSITILGRDSKNLTVYKCPFWEAKNKGVYKLQFFILISAFNKTNCSTIYYLPYYEAHSIGYPSHLLSKGSLTNYGYFLNTNFTS